MEIQFDWTFAKLFEVALPFVQANDSSGVTQGGVTPIEPVQTFPTSSASSP